MNKILLLLALISFSEMAVAADVAKPASPHGGAAALAGSGMPAGHLDSIPADTRLINGRKVLDVIDTDMYTYVQVTHEQGSLWLAAYKTNITKGATVKYSGGIAMTTFQALNRTFDLIVFVDTLEQAK